MQHHITTSGRALDLALDLHPLVSLCSLVPVGVFEGGRTVYRPPCPETLAFRSKEGGCAEALPLYIMLIGVLGVLVSWFMLCGVLCVGCVCEIPGVPSASFGWSPPTRGASVGRAVLPVHLGDWTVVSRAYSCCPSDGLSRRC
jgi:hypothetical protein